MDLEGPHLLGGVRTDALILDHPKEVFAVILVLDFPFSFALDALVLPYTLPRALFFDPPSYELPDGSLSVKKGPPPPRPEIPPEALRPDQAWLPGYWEWDQDGERYFWAEGEIQTRPRPDVIWTADAWEKDRNGWHRLGGHWTLRR